MNAAKLKFIAVVDLEVCPNNVPCPGFGVAFRQRSLPFVARQTEKWRSCGFGRVAEIDAPGAVVARRNCSRRSQDRISLIFQSTSSWSPPCGRLCGCQFGSSPRTVANQVRGSVPSKVLVHPRSELPTVLAILYEPSTFASLRFPQHDRHLHNLSFLYPQLHSRELPKAKFLVQAPPVLGSLQCDWETLALGKPNAVPDQHGPDASFLVFRMYRNGRAMQMYRHVPVQRMDLRPKPIYGRPISPASAYTPPVCVLDRQQRLLGPRAPSSFTVPALRQRVCERAGGLEAAEADGRLRAGGRIGVNGDGIARQRVCEARPYEANGEGVIVAWMRVAVWKEGRVELGGTKGEGPENRESGDVAAAHWPEMVR